MGVSTSSGKLRSYWLCVPGVSMVTGGLPTRFLWLDFVLGFPSLGTAGCHTISYPLCVPGVSIKAGYWWCTRYKTSHHHLFGLQASSCTAVSKVIRYCNGLTSRFHHLTNQKQFKPSAICSCGYINAWSHPITCNYFELAPCDILLCSD